MGLLFPDDSGYDLEIRQTGFNRYKQCLSFYRAGWWKAGLLTLLGAVPLCAVITVSILSTSILLLLPGSFLCGMLFGPFLACLYDAVLRGLRDDARNWRDSLLPGGILGFLLGVYAFMAALLWWAQIPPTAGTLFLYAFAGFLLVLVTTLFWPQLVLFQQTNWTRMRNIVLFTAKYLWRVSAVTILQMLYAALLLLFAPWSLLLLPILGLWYVLFLSQFFLYDALNREFQIEERLGLQAESER